MSISPSVNMVTCSRPNSVLLLKRDARLFARPSTTEHCTAHRCSYSCSASSKSVEVRRATLIIFDMTKIRKKPTRKKNYVVRAGILSWTSIARLLGSLARVGYRSLAAYWSLTRRNFARHRTL